MLIRRLVPPQERKELWELSKVIRGDCERNTTTLTVEDRGRHGHHDESPKRRHQTVSDDLISTGKNHSSQPKRNFNRRAAGNSNRVDRIEGPAIIWQRQQLGWAGAVSSVLGIRKLNRVADWTPEGARDVDSSSSDNGTHSIVDD